MALCKIVLAMSFLAFAPCTEGVVSYAEDARASHGVEAITIDAQGSVDKGPGPKHQRLMRNAAVAEASVHAGDISKPPVDEAEGEDGGAEVPPEEITQDQDEGSEIETSEDLETDQDEDLEEIETLGHVSASLPFGAGYKTADVFGAVRRRSEGLIQQNDISRRRRNRKIDGCVGISMGKWLKLDFCDAHRTGRWSYTGSTNFNTVGPTGGMVQIQLASDSSKCVTLSSGKYMQLGTCVNETAQQFGFSASGQIKWAQDPSMCVRNFWGWMKMEKCGTDSRYTFH